MKIKTLITLVLMVCLGYTASAQSYRGKKRSSASSISFGPRAGATFSTFTEKGDEEEGTEMGYLAGVQVGAVANFPITGFVSLQPEVLFIQKGFAGTFDMSEQVMGFDYNVKGTADYRTNYLEVPVLAKATFGLGNLGFFITAGPTVGYWMSGNSKYEYTTRVSDGTDTMEETEAADEKVRFEDGEKRFELGANIGAGLAFRLGTGTLNLDLRYGQGFTNVLEVEDTAPPKNRVIGISIAYLFGI